MSYCCSLRRMVLWPFILLVLLSQITIHVNSQTNFVSIDCGYDSSTSYVDTTKGLTYVPDSKYIDTGVNRKISSQYPVDQDMFNDLATLRSFPNGTKNCYSLNPLTQGYKYLVRATFYYGNYDKLNWTPTFDIYLGVNFWSTVDITAPDYYFFYEIIATAPADYMHVCLVNTGQGTPFISTLVLRPLSASLYELANSNQSLVLFSRKNVGSDKHLLRYPDDRHDRLWFNYSQSSWTALPPSDTVSIDVAFETPSEVLQTAAGPSTTKESLDIYWSSDDTSKVFLVVLHFAEIQTLKSTDYRAFYMYDNGELLFEDPFAPKYLKSGYAYYHETGKKDYNLSLKATKDSTLPPILNALEIYTINPVALLPTSTGDVTAITTIKTHYEMNKGWSGDPCVPTKLSWTGINCTFNTSNIPRITSLDLSSSGLTGALISAFGDLTATKLLNLSGNKLSGSLPAFLDQLVALTLLDITGNSDLSTMLPPGLKKRQEAGTLTYRYGNSTPSSSSPTRLVRIIAPVVVVLVVIAAAILLFLYMRKSYVPVGHLGGAYPNVPQHPQQGGAGGPIGLESRQFTYKDLKLMTNNFQNNVGTGGFGSVYSGCLDNGTLVAVKMRSHSSSQGVKEFLAEAQNLTRVHHKNLVSLLGYCMDGDYMALVYEYMPEGTLENKLKDSARPLTWKQRLRIVCESAQGLDYLHKSCNPPLIHRDVKSNNILLNSNLEAKIADFGLSREFNNDVSSHVSTAVVGTPGYLDPEYYSAYQLSEKSDVFSFGVVLLEIVTGQPLIIAGPQGGHISQWVRQRLSKGDIESIVDSRIQGQYDINSVWKVTTLAEKCTNLSSSKRPTMNIIVAELKESLELEISTEGTRTTNTTFMSQYTNQYNYSRNDDLVSDVSQNSGLEMAYMGGMPAPGPSAR